MYEYFINNLNVSEIVNSKETVIEQSLCTNEFTSATDTASFTIISHRNVNLYNTIVELFLNNREASPIVDIPASIVKNGIVVFRGFVDNSSLTLQSAKIAKNLTITLRSKIILLDKVCKENWGYENKARSSLVSELLAMARTNIPLNYSELPDSKVIRAIANQDDDGNTYREIIDNILLESVGYVLIYNHTDDCFNIVKIADTYTGNEKKVVYRIENELQTQQDIYDNDGILLSFPTIETKENQNLYADNIDVGINNAHNYDDSLLYDIGEYVKYSDKLYRCKIKITTPEPFNLGKWIKVADNIILGKQIKPEYYYPEDADIKATYQNYNVDGVDREYITKQSRLKNSDLSLIFAKECYYSIISSPSLSLSPPLPNIEYPGVQYLPRKAWIVFRNDNNEASNITGFSITGTIVYRSKVNKITAPLKKQGDEIISTVTNPEEITAQTITLEDEAREYANFVFNTHKYSKTISNWTDVKGDVKLGDVVSIVHKDTNITIPSVVTKIETKNISGNINIYDITAFSISGYQKWNKDNYTTSTENKKEDVVATPVTVTQYCYGNEKEPLSALVGVDNDNVVADNDKTLGFAGWTSEQLPVRAGYYIWVRIGTYIPPQNENSITSWVMYRLAGEPKEFNLTASSMIYVRNLRTPYELNVITLIPTMRGYSGVPNLKVFMNVENGEECPYFNDSTNVLTIPYNVSDKIKSLICVYTLITGDGEQLQQKIILHLEDKTGDIIVYEHTTVPRLAIYDTATGQWKDQYDNYLLIGDSYVLANEDYITTDDEAIEAGKKYYYYSSEKECFLVLQDFSNFPYVDSFKNVKAYEKKVTSNVMSFTGSKWENLAKNLNRNNYRYYDRNLTENLSNVFDLYKDIFPNANHIESNGYDWFKQIIAQYISATYYYVGGAIYSGGFNHQGLNPKNEPGLFLGADGKCKVVNIEISGNSKIGGDTIIGGTIVNTLDGLNEQIKVFETNKTQSDTIVFKSVADETTKTFKWDELEPQINTYYKLHLQEQNIVELAENAFVDNKPVKYVCLNVPQLKQISETVPNTRQDNTYHETQHVTIPLNHPNVGYRIYLRQTAESGSDWGGFNVEYWYGKVTYCLIRNNELTETTIIEAAKIPRSISKGILDVVEGITTFDFNTGLDIEGGDISFTQAFKAGDEFFYRFYGCFARKHNHRTKDGEYAVTVVDDPLREGLNCIDENLNFLGTINSIFQNAKTRSPFCEQPATGFVNVTPLSFWTGNDNMSFNSSYWAISNVKSYYKMSISQFTLNDKAITDNRFYTLTQFSLPADRTFNILKYKNLNYKNIEYISVSRTSLILKMTNTSSPYTFNINSYSDSDSEYAFDLISNGRPYGGYAVNMIPLLDNDGTEELGNVGNLGTATQRWKNGFIGNIHFNNLYNNDKKCAFVVESWKSGTSWYRVWSDGWCEQGGYVVLTPNTIQKVTLFKNYQGSYKVFLTGQQIYIPEPVVFCGYTGSPSSFSAILKTSTYSKNVVAQWFTQGYIS